MRARSKYLGINNFGSPEGARIAFKWVRTLEYAVKRAGAMVLLTPSSLGKRYTGPLHDDRLRMNSNNEKIASKARKREAMRLGHAIEDWLRPEFLAELYNKKWGGNVKCWNDLRSGGHVAKGNRGDFLVERSGERPPLFPINFFRAGARPDIRIGLGDGTEAVFDFTTAGEAGHLLKKGGGIVKKDRRIAFACEIVTLPWSRRDPEMAKALYELDPKINPPPGNIPP